MEKKLEELGAVTTHRNDLGSWLEYNDWCSQEEDMELSEWLNNHSLADKLMDDNRDSAAKTLADFGKGGVTVTLFGQVQGHISEVVGDDSMGVGDFSELPFDSPLILQLDEACQDIKETWEGLNLTFMDLDELLGRWAYLFDSPQNCYDDISEVLNYFYKEVITNGSNL